MNYNAGALAARNRPPRCIAHLRTELLDKPPKAFISSFKGGVWTLDHGDGSAKFGVTESAFFSLGLYRPGETATPLAYRFMDLPGARDSDVHRDLLIAPIYIEWDGPNKEVPSRTLVFDPRFHGYEAEVTRLEHQTPSERKSRGAGELTTVNCKRCGDTSGCFSCLAAFCYADEIEEVDDSVPLEDLFEAMVLFGHCPSCDRLSLIFDSVV